MAKNRIFAGMATLLLLAVRVGADGSWLADGINLCDAAGTRSSPQIVSDGSGGVFIGWNDGRPWSSLTHVYLQHFNAAGQALWKPADGIQITEGSHQEMLVQMIPDNAHGVVLLTMSLIAFPPPKLIENYFLQHVDADGNTLWPYNSQLLCPSAVNPASGCMINDGTGNGFIVAWRDARTAAYNLYAQRFDWNAAPQWMAAGMPVCITTNTVQAPSLAPDGFGGALFAWADERNGHTYETYAQYVSNTGNFLQMFGGVRISSTVTAASGPQMASDGAGGAMVAWWDQVSGNPVILAQRLDTGCNPVWSSVATVCNATGPRQNLKVLADPAGAFLAWEDMRSGNYDLYAQRLDLNGNSLGTANGFGLCQAPNDQTGMSLVRDAAGCIVAAWNDTRNGYEPHVYAQRLRPDGTLLWGDGIPLCQASGSQSGPQLAPAAPGGAVVVWNDSRAGNLYAQKILRPVPAITGLTPASAPRGKVFPNLSVNGQFFQDDQGAISYLALTRTGQGSLPAFNLVVNSSTALHANFDLTNALTGDWQIVGYDSLGQTVAAAAALSVYAPQLKSLDWVSVPAAVVFAGSQDNLLGQINCTAAGYDQMVSMTVSNLGTGTSADISRLSLWRCSAGRSSGITFDPKAAQRLGDFSPAAAKTWRLTQPQDVYDSDALYLTANLDGAAAPGRTLRFSLGAGQAPFVASANMPGETLLNLYEQTVAVNVSLQAAVTALAGPNLTAGETGVSLARVTLTNVSGNNLTLSSLALAAYDGQGSPVSLGALFQRLSLAAGGTTVSSLTAPIPAAQLFSFSVSLQPGQQAAFDLSGDCLAHPSVTEFQLGLANGQCINQGAWRVVPSGSATFPLLTPPWHLRSATLSAVFSNYPNPFQAGREVTRIAYFLREPGQVTLEILTPSRERVWSWTGSEQPSGVSEQVWDGRNGQGQWVKSGVYLLKLSVVYASGGKDTQTRKLAVVR